MRPILRFSSLAFFEFECFLAVTARPVRLGLDYPQQFPLVEHLAGACRVVFRSQRPFQFLAREFVAQTVVHLFPPVYVAGGGVHAEPQQVLVEHRVGHPNREIGR